jgi:secondary thiamine-phosphate synthase enzyme
MKSSHKHLSIATDRKQELIDLSSQLEQAVAESFIQDGFAGIYSQHTTAAVFVSEFQQALLDDIGGFLERLVQDDVFYKHNSPRFSDCDRHNAASHLRSLLLQHSVFVPVQEGKLLLGQFQRVIFAELDGPRTRSLRIQVLGE